MAFSDILLVLNQQSAGVFNKGGNVDADSTLVTYFSSGHKTVAFINGWYYLIVRVVDASTYIPTLYVSRDGISWSKKVEIHSALTGDDIFNSVCLDYDSFNHILHFVYTADAAGNLTYRNYNLLTDVKSNANTFTAGCFPPASIAVNETGEWVIVAAENADPASLLYIYKKDNVIVLADLTAVAGSDETSGPNQPIIQYCKRDKLFHVLVGKRASNYLDWWTYELQTDKWEKRPNPPFSDVLASAPNDPTGANKGKNFILSLISDQYGFLHATVQEAATGKVYYSKYGGGGWTDKETVGTGTVTNLNPSFGVEGSQQFSSFVQSTSLKLFERIEKDRFEAVTNTLTITAETGANYSSKFEDRKLLTAFRGEAQVRAAYHEITIEEQTSYKKVFQWLDQNDVAVDLTAYDVEMELKEEPGGTVIDTYSTAKSHITTGTDGKATIVVGADETEGLNFGAAIYSLKALLRTGSALVEAGSWTSSTFDVSLSGKGTVLADGGTPFSTLAAGDYISMTITTAVRILHSGIYKLDAATSTLLTFTSIMEGVDGVGSTDISIYKLDPDNFFRLVEGPVRLSRDATIIP